MKQSNLVEIIKDQTDRALWEVKNVIDCVYDDMWNKEYCNAPLWQHIYHMLHSLDMWFINPFIYDEPVIHTDNLNNLDIKPEVHLSKTEIYDYYYEIRVKIEKYILSLTDDKLLEYPENCRYTIFTLILAQFRHLHSHMGMIMGFIIDDKNMWPAVLGLEIPIPTDGNYTKYC